MAIVSHPHWKTNVVDNSIYRPFEEENLPLHLPICPMKAQSGEIGVPVWCKDFNTAKTIFGSETFNEQNKLYYSLQARFAMTMFPNHGLWIIRLADTENASASNVVLEAQVITDAECPRWIRDGEGVVTYELGKPVVARDAGNADAPFTDPGMAITWRTRALLPIELEAGIENISTVTSTTNIAGDTVVYPIMVALNVYEGLLGDDMCFALYRDFANLDTFMIQNLKSQLYTMAPSKKIYGNTAVESILDENGNVSNVFSFAKDMVDPTTTAKMSFSDHFPKRYPELPMSYAIYDQHIATIGSAWVTAYHAGEYDDQGITVTPVDGMLVDIFTGKDFKNDPYEYLWVVTSETAVVDVVGTVGLSFSSANNIYTTGGADGVLDDYTIEAELIKFTSGTLAPTIVDKLRYPITHIYDAGYSIDTKKALLEIMALRDDIIVTIASQDLSVHYGPTPFVPVYEAGVANPTNGLKATINTEYLDESSAIMLRSYGLLFPESLDKGTGGCRFSINLQAGTLESGEIVPCSLRIAQMRAEFMNTGSLKEMFGGRPNSECELFESVNYTPSSEDSKGRLWAAGGNYLSYYDRTGLFYAALRTGYQHETSVLSDLYFMDVIAFTKHAIGRSWTVFSGVQIPFNVLQQQISDDLTNRISTIFSGKYTFSIRVYQTSEEANRGYETHVAVDITAPASNRVWNVDINCSREGYTPA